MELFILCLMFLLKSLFTLMVNVFVKKTLILSIMTDFVKAITNR